MVDQLRTLPRQLLALYAGTVITRLGTFVVPYLTLVLSVQRGLSLASTGRIIAAGGVGLLLGNGVGGWMADRAGRKRTLLIALAVNAVGLTALGLGLPTHTAYALALALAMAGAGMYTPAANAWIADLTTASQRQLAYTVNYICINVGMGVGPLVGGVLAGVSFRWLFVGDVASTVVCAVCIASTTGPGRAPALGRVGTAPRLRIRMVAEMARWLAPNTRPVLFFCGASFLVTAPLMGMEITVPLLVARVLDAPLVTVGLVYSINAACILALGLPIGRAIRGRDPRLMMALAGVLWALGLTILKVGLSTAALLGCTVVWTLGEIISSVVVPTFVSQSVPAAVRGRFLALADAMRSLAGIVAPAVLGVVWERQGVDAVLWILVATPTLGAWVFAGAWFRRRLARAAVANR